MGRVDGPSHFHFLGKNPTGSTILKHRQVSNLGGIPLVSVPYWELGVERTWQTWKE